MPVRIKFARFTFLLPVLLALLGASSCFLPMEKPTAKEIVGNDMFVDAEGEKIIIKIQTYSSPRRYFGKRAVKKVWFEDSLSTKKHSRAGLSSNDLKINRYVHKDMLVIEFDKRNVMQWLGSFNRVSVILSRGTSSFDEVYSYKSDNYILDIPAHDRLDEDCPDSDYTECHYQRLLERWYNGADGQLRAPVDSAVKRRLQERRGKAHYKYREFRKQLDDLEQYRGLGISIYDDDLFPNSLHGLSLTFIPVAIKMVKEFYGIDADTRIIHTGIWNHSIDRNFDIVAGVRGLPNDEAIVFLISGTTLEVLSTYRYKENRAEKMF